MQIRGPLASNTIVLACSILAKAVFVSTLFGLVLNPMATAQMLESQRIRSGQTQIGTHQERIQVQSGADVRPASFQTQPTSVNGVPFSTQTEPNKQTQISPTEIKLKEPSRGTEGRISKPSSQWSTLFSVGFSLGIVVCLFLGVAWVAKKSMPAGSGRLPNEVVEVLGRSTIAPRQQIYVLRFGRKLLLVSQQPGQTQTLSEITDEEEVIRLAGICEENSPRSATRTFSDVLKQVASGKAEPQNRAQRRSA